MRTLFSFVLMTGLFLLMACSAPTASRAISQGGSDSSSGSIQLPDSFQDLRWSSWSGYDTNYQYSVSTTTNGSQTWGNFFVVTLPHIASFSLESNQNSATVNGLSVQFSGNTVRWINGTSINYQIKVKLESDPNLMEATLYLEITPDISPNISKAIRMRRAFR